MCVSPHTLPEIGPVACRKCWQCRSNRVNDLVGRSIAEQNVSSDTMAVTLTYDDLRLYDPKTGRDQRAHVTTLVYSDVQKFLKRLRLDYNVRFLVAGEYGSNSGRAHWHIILFFDGAAPERCARIEIEKSLLKNTPRTQEPVWADKVCNEERFYWKYWPHGVVYFEKPDYGGFAYILKYVIKNEKLGISIGHKAQSLKPPLGHKWFMELIDRYVEQGLSPQTPYYSFRDQFDNKGKRRRFYLQGRMHEIFVETFLLRWAEQYDSEPPFSEMIDLYTDGRVRNDPAFEAERFMAGLEYPKVRIEPDPIDQDHDAVYNPGKGTEYYRLGYTWTRDDIIIRHYTESMFIINALAVNEEQQQWPANGENELQSDLRAMGNHDKLPLQMWPTLEQAWRQRNSVSTPT